MNSLFFHNEFFENVWKHYLFLVETLVYIYSFHGIFNPDFYFESKAVEISAMVFVEYENNQEAVIIIDGFS